MSAQLHDLAEPIWQAQLANPFVRGIGNGTLDVEKFGFWLRQDYLFLIDYCRVFAFAAARAPDLAGISQFAGLLQDTLTIEMELHRSYVAEFGITVEDLEREQAAPTTRGYCDFLLRTAATGDYPELLGAILPCMWGYSELGQELKRRGLPAEPRYAHWIETYADPGFADLAAWCRDALDDASAGLPEAALAKVEAAFVTSSRYELAFWEMAWRGETWPV